MTTVMPTTAFPTTVTSVLAAGRFDAEFFQPEFVANAASLMCVETEPLPAVAAVSDGNHLAVSHDFRTDPSDAVRYLRGQDLGGYVLGERSPVFVGQATYDRLVRSHIMPGDVLLSIVGTVGALSLVPDDAPPLTGSCKIAILRPKSGKIAPAYLAAFLSSRHGRAQIKRLTRGAVQTGLILADMGQLRVARLGALEEEISRRVGKAERALRAARNELRQVGDYLPMRWGFVPPAVDDLLGRSVALEEMNRARRWDAEYYSPEYEAHHTAILGLSAVRGLSPVKGVLASLTNGQTPRHHDLSCGEIRFVTAENVVGFETDFDTEKRVLQTHHQGQLRRTALHEGDVLFTIKGRVGDVSPLVHEPAHASNVNQDVAVLRLKQGTHPFFFAAWFNSCLGRMFVRQCVTGAINPFLGLGTLARLPFPNVHADEQHAVGEYVKDSVSRAVSAKAVAQESLAECADLVDASIERSAQQQ